MEEKILKYFKKRELKILDKEDVDKDQYYTGVTVKYIAKYITQKPLSDTAKTLLKLHEEDKIRALYCGDVRNVVFESTEHNSHWNFRKDEDGDSTNLQDGLYSSFIKNINSFIKNEVIESVRNE